LRDTQNEIAGLVARTREVLNKELQAQAENVARLEQSLKEVQERHQTIAAALQSELDQLAKYEPPLPPPPPKPEEAPLEKLLSSVRNLITATMPDQVLDALAEEAVGMGVRAAVFDVRGKAAWGASARGFGSGLAARDFRSVIIPLNKDNAFRQVYDTGAHVDATLEMLRKNRNLVDKIKPCSDCPILLLPVRSAGAVSAIIYCDAGDSGEPLPVEALNILAEFAGAQIDRLMALGGEIGEEEVAPTPTPEAMEEPAAVPGMKTPPAKGAKPESSASVESDAQATVGVTPPPAAPEEKPPAPDPALEPSPAAEPPVLVPGMSEPVAASSPLKVPELAPAPQPSASSEGVPTPEPVAPEILTPPVKVEPAPEPPPLPKPEPPSLPRPAAVFEISALSEGAQKLHKDARRFAKLLVSEIELYNKVKVADGRKARDLYKRLKSDIDRSRQTFDKRFGKTVTQQFDYFHDELVRTLAQGEAALLGTDYPGPAA
jgi:hypothetical protein